MLSVAKAISEYLYRDSGDWVEPEELLERNEPIGIAYTVTEDDEEIQVEADISHMMLKTYVDGKLVETIQYESAEEMCAEFEVCDFDDFVGME